MSAPPRSDAPPAAWAIRWAHTLRRYAVSIVVACLLATGVSVALASGLSISTDLSAVLPRGYPSVEDLHKLLARIGGTAQLIVAIESPELEANERFADELVRRLHAEMGDDIANLDFKVDALHAFYKKHAAVYLSEKDLLGIEQDLKDAEHKKVAQTPLYDILGDDEPAPKQAGGTTSKLGDLTKRLDDADKEWAHYPDGYYAGENGHLLAIYIRPRTSGADSKDARAIIAHVQRIIDAIGPKKYEPSMKVSFTGNYQAALDEQDAIKRDLASTAGLCIGLIALAVFAYFRRVRVLMLLGATLVCGCAWAFGLARVAVGYLNIQTAFLGSIIAGTGINYGIILLARYLEERRRGVDDTVSLARALETTLVATLTASATTAISFGTLFIARISSFRHFAIIGGGGILFCWILSFTLLPALLVLSNRIAPMVKQAEAGVHWPALLSAVPLRFPRVVVGASLLACMVSIGAFVHFLPNALETDGRNLRNKQPARGRANKMDDRVTALRGQSTSPGFIVTDSIEEAKRVCEVLDARIAQQGELAPISSCRSIYSLLPKNPDEKLAIARRVLAKIDSLPDDAFDAADKKRIDDLRGQLELTTVTLADLPEELTRPFREVDGHIGRLVAVTPPHGRDLWIAKNLYEFTDAIRRIDLGDGRVVTSSGDAVVFADILRMITRDAPRTTLLALFGVMLFVFLALRGGRATAHVVGSLVVGVLWMVGIASLAKVKINFFNFVAVPTTFGIAVDYAINVYARFTSARGEHAERLRETLAETGGAVALCSITTVIGYATLIIADNMALVSFGKLAILGELTCVATALFVLPATLLLDKKA